MMHETWLDAATTERSGVGFVRVELTTLGLAQLSPAKSLDTEYGLPVCQLRRPQLTPLVVSGHLWWSLAVSGGL